MPQNFMKCEGSSFPFLNDCFTKVSHPDDDRQSAERPRDRSGSSRMPGASGLQTDREQGVLLAWHLISLEKEQNLLLKVVKKTNYFLKPSLRQIVLGTSNYFLSIFNL